jgi:hypothetical protein
MQNTTRQRCVVYTSELLRKLSFLTSHEQDARSNHMLQSWLKISYAEVQLSLMRNETAIKPVSELSDTEISSIIKAAFQVSEGHKLTGRLCNNVLPHYVCTLKHGVFVLKEKKYRNFNHLLERVAKDLVDRHRDRYASVMKTRLLIDSLLEKSITEMSSARVNEDAAHVQISEAGMMAKIVLIHRHVFETIQSTLLSCDEEMCHETMRAGSPVAFRYRDCPYLSYRVAHDLATVNRVLSGQLRNHQIPLWQINHYKDLRMALWMKTKSQVLARSELYAVFGARLLQDLGYASHDSSGGHMPHHDSGPVPPTTSPGTSGKGKGKGTPPSPVFNQSHSTNGEEDDEEDDEEDGDE